LTVLESTSPSDRTPIHKGREKEDANTRRNSVTRLLAPARQAGAAPRRGGAFEQFDATGHLKSHTHRRMMRQTLDYLVRVARTEVLSRAG
jgi:hypothetical protein